MKKLSEFHIAQARSINSKISELKNFRPQEVCLGTNEGTFSAEECHRKTRSGDPIHGNYTLWVNPLTGDERVEGCDPEIAPGYLRKNENAASQIAEAKQQDEARKTEIKRLQKELDGFDLADRGQQQELNR